MQGEPTSIWWPFTIIAAAVAGLYAIHRLMLYMESRGWVYYMKTKSSSGSASSFIAFQEMIEPTIKHVIHIKEQKRHHSEEEAPGADPNDEQGSPAARE